jgi:hypothetical protein
MMRGLGWTYFFHAGEPAESRAEVKESGAIHLLCLWAFVGCLGGILPLPTSFSVRITCTVGTADSWNLNGSKIKKAIKCQYLNLMLSVLSISLHDSYM